MSSGFTICEHISNKRALRKIEIARGDERHPVKGKAFSCWQPKVGDEMGFRILFDEVKLKQGMYQRENDRESEPQGVGWPRGTWFQKRLRQVRQQQRRKLAETDFVYECALGTIIIRRSNGKD